MDGSCPRVHAKNGSEPSVLVRGFLFFGLLPYLAAVREIRNLTDGGQLEIVEMLKADACRYSEAEKNI